VLPRRRVLLWYYCGLAAAVLVVGTVAATQWAGTRHSGDGTLLLMASSRTSDHMTGAGISVRSSGGWHDAAGRFDTAVAKAPETTRLAQVTLPAGVYDAIRIGGSTLETHITLHAQQVEPVLIPIASGRPAAEGLYTGTEQFNVGLDELAGQVVPMASFDLLDQHGRSFTNASIRGKTVVVAAFHTSCQTTCPLYTGLFLQLQRRLPSSVVLVEATTDPGQDTPDALQRYAQQIDAPWTFVTGTPDQMTAFWKPLGVQLSGDQLHTSTLAVLDGHGYIRSVYRGVPDVGGVLPPQLMQSLNATGMQELRTHGDGWGLSQISDTLSAVDRPGTQPQVGGQQAPSFSTTDLSGKPISAAQFRGRPVLINFWATWCGPCRQEMPLIQRTAKAHPGLAVILVNERDSTGSARSFVSQLGVTLPVASDPDGSIGGDYLVGALPTSVFVRADGTIASRYPGAMDQRTIDTHLVGLGLT
jgi:cytochrome oxidase Cu insertion factor (SCO1/SenC/PrrC family)